MQHPIDTPSLIWRKASRSGSSGNDCVELAALPGGVAVRDSKNPDGDVLAFTPGALARLAAAIKHDTL